MVAPRMLRALSLEGLNAIFHQAVIGLLLINPSLFGARRRGRTLSLSQAAMLPICRQPSSGESHAAPLVGKSPLRDPPPSLMRSPKSLFLVTNGILQLNHFPACPLPAPAASSHHGSGTAASLRPNFGGHKPFREHDWPHSGTRNRLRWMQLLADLGGCNMAEGCLGCSSTKESPGVFGFNSER